MVSVLIPVHNGAAYLEAGVRSILEQTYTDLEVLVLDDGSDDGSLDVLGAIADPRLRVERSEENRGVSETLNRGVRLARGAWVARLDQDDLAEPQRLARQVEVLEDDTALLGCLSQVSRIGADGRSFGSYRTGREGTVTRYHPDTHGSLLHSTACFRREALLHVGGYRAALFPADDLDLLYRLWERGPLAVIEASLVRYRIHPAASTFAHFREMQSKTRYLIAMSARRRRGEPEVSVEDFLRADARAPLFRRVRRGLAERGMLRFRRAGMELGRGRTSRALVHLACALVLHPRFALARLLQLGRQSGSSRSSTA